MSHLDLQQLKMSLFWLVALVSLTLQSFTLNALPCRSCKRSSCDCSRLQLTGVPGPPSPAITHLDISFNKITTIQKDDFLIYVNLRSLKAASNGIKAIHDQALDPLVHLENLDLSSNALPRLNARWFLNLQSLQHLNLLRNNYRTLGRVPLFPPLKQLKTLRVGGPTLKSVRTGVFSGLEGLEELDFDGRNLQNYAKGSLGEAGTIDRITLGLNGPFLSYKELVEVILSDVADPNTTLTFTDTFFFADHQLSPFRVLHDRGSREVIFQNVNMTISACLELLIQLSGSEITMVGLEDITLFLTPLGQFVRPPSLKHLEVVVLKNVHVPGFYNFPALLFLHPLLTLVRRASLINSQFFIIPCPSTAVFSSLEYLDFSENVFSDLALSGMLCGGEGVLMNLQTLNMSRNHLQTINSRLFTKMEKLQNLDLSGNTFNSMPETCYWPRSLQFLNLSMAHLSRVTRCLPPSLQMLDLSHNDLSTFNIHLPLLTELRISRNKIVRLPEGHLFPRLASISIQNNNLQTFTSKELGSYEALRALAAGANTYVCSCEFVALMAGGEAERGVTLQDHMDSYICDSPDEARGRSAAEVRLSVFECHAVLALTSLCSGIVLVLLLAAWLAHRFSVPWYARMTWAWLRAKRKPKLKREELRYDAFISYSQMDSGWVEAHLVPELEQSRPPLRLCLHKRDFLPGGWILDNIMDAIEKSHRTLFVLSRHFVNSEWCKYELDYSHFRLFDQNQDAAVLVLLEPIAREAIPKKFCKLRKFMNSRTYLEWPGDERLEPQFWQSLRAAIQRPDHGNL